MWLSLRRDHRIVVGRVDNLRTSPIGDPLVFFAGAFATVSAQVMVKPPSTASVWPVT